MYSKDRKKGYKNFLKKINKSNDLLEQASKSSNEQKGVCCAFYLSRTSWESGTRGRGDHIE